MKKKIVTVDVREDLRGGREPFSKIMQAAAALQEGQDLLLVAPFEPSPLYGVLAQQGFSHQAKATEAGDWEVLFTRGTATPPDSKEARKANAAAGNPSPGACSGPPVLDVDARRLEPPQPLVKILEAIATLPKGARLRAHTDRRPMHLYAQLEERGFAGETEEQADGSFVTMIDRVAK